METMHLQVANPAGRKGVVAHSGQGAAGLPAFPGPGQRQCAARDPASPRNQSHILPCHLPQVISPSYFPLTL